MNKQLDAIPLQFDSTDHFDFLCPDCGCKMKILNTHSYEVPHLEKQMRCTAFNLKCPMCSGQGHRKIYWNNTDRNIHA